MQTKVVNLRRDTYDVYIGRGSLWGNPFVIGKDGTREEVIAKYKQWIVTQPHMLARLHELQGKTLGCYCAPKICHGDILARMAEEVSMYSEKEQAMFKDLGFEDLLIHLTPPVLYKLAIEDAFLKNKTGPVVESLRRTGTALKNCNPYRGTPEFDALIQL